MKKQAQPNYHLSKDDIQYLLKSSASKKALTLAIPNEWIDREEEPRQYTKEELEKRSADEPRRVAELEAAKAEIKRWKKGDRLDAHSKSFIRASVEMGILLAEIKHAIFNDYARASGKGRYSKAQLYNLITNAISREGTVARSNQAWMDLNYSAPTRGGEVAGSKKKQGADRWRIPVFKEVEKLRKQRPSFGDERLAKMIDRRKFNAPSVETISEQITKWVRNGDLETSTKHPSRRKVGK